jgi:hypothetical protein
MVDITLCFAKKNNIMHLPLWVLVDGYGEGGSNGRGFS